MFTSITWLIVSGLHYDTFFIPREFYAVFDREKKGYVAAEDLRHVFHHLGSAVTPEEIEELMTDLDKDGDGKITYEEYNSMIMKQKSGNN